MKAKLLYWHKAKLRGRYIIELKIHWVGKSERYRDGVKYGLFFMDEQSGKRILMDNHHPKGPHVHIDDKESPYLYVDEKKLIKDFQAFALNHSGVKI